ncbi:hypothetical protein PC119_g13570 [Phytophthora cactorum]|nr:hypothetical protein PC119_g13570 [Phytophthora cactorum]
MRLPMPPGALKRVAKCADDESVVDQVFHVKRVLREEDPRAPDSSLATELPSFLVSVKLLAQDGIVSGLELPLDEAATYHPLLRPHSRLPDCRLCGSLCLHVHDPVTEAAIV